MRKLTISIYNPSQSLACCRLWSVIVILILHSSLFTFRSFAQTAGTLSPYSRFGLGLLHDQSQGFNKSMGGAGLGVRMGNRINTSNPASYAVIDSLSLILDIGMTGSFGRMRQDEQRAAAKGASFDYVHVGMHIAKNLGLAAGFMPYTDIGYDFCSPEETVGYNPDNMQPIKSNSAYTGRGGLNQAYLGLGWKVFRNFAIGANVSFLWGKYDHTLLQQFSEGSSSSNAFSYILKNNYASIRSYKVDLGAQYPVRVSKQDWLSFGLTASLGHKIPQEATVTIGEKTDTVASPFDLPYTFGFGLAWQHKNTLLLATDAHYECWSNCRLPIETMDGFVPMKGLYKDRTKIAVGAQWTPDPFSTIYWKRIQYRAGMNFATPHLIVNGLDGPYEFCMSIGAGVPITNRINNRSFVNVGLQWLRRASHSAGMVTENYFLINLGVTFNERWFMKYKIY